MRYNLKKHEHIGLLLVFIGASWLGFSFYATLLAANRMLVNITLLNGKELLLFPLFYGIGALILTLGSIEIKEALPGKNR